MYSVFIFKAQQVRLCPYTQICVLPLEHGGPTSSQVLRQKQILFSQKVSISNSSTAMGALHVQLPSSRPNFGCLEIVQVLSLLSTTVVRPYAQLFCCVQKSVFSHSYHLQHMPLTIFAFALQSSLLRVRMRRCDTYATFRTWQSTASPHLNFDHYISLC